MDTNARKIKRQNIEVKEKERQMDTNAKKNKKTKYCSERERKTNGYK